MFTEDNTGQIQFTFKGGDEVLQKVDILRVMRDENTLINTVALFIVLPEHPEKEIILVHRNNFKAKSDYIDKTYSENLEHKHDNRVKIVSVGYYTTPLIAMI